MSVLGFLAIVGLLFSHDTKPNDEQDEEFYIDMMMLDDEEDD